MHGTICSLPRGSDMIHQRLTQFPGSPGACAFRAAAEMAMSQSAAVVQSRAVLPKFQSAELLSKLVTWRLEAAVGEQCRQNMGLTLVCGVVQVLR